MASHQNFSGLVEMSNDVESGLTDSESFLGIDLRQFLVVLRRNKLFIALVVAAFLIAGVLITIFMVPSYSATSLVLIEDEGEQIIEGTDLSPSVTGVDTDRFLQTQLEILRSRALAAKVVADGKFAQDEKFYEAMGTSLPLKSELEGKDASTEGYREYLNGYATELVQDALNASLMADSRVGSITIVTNYPNYSARIANLYAQSFIENNLNRKFNSSAYARQFLATQLEQARVKLENSEKDLNQYSRAAGLIRVTGTGNGGGNGETALSITNDTLVNLNNQASQATSDRIAAEQEWNAIASQPVLSVPEVLANSAIQQLVRQKADIEGRLAQERAKHLDDYPTVVGLKAQAEEIENRIEDIGQSIKNSIKLNYQAAREREQTLLAQVDKTQTNAIEEQNRGVQYSVLKRVADTNRGLYDSLLARYNQLNAASGALTNNITMVDSAEVPSEPSSPRLSVNILISLLLGAAAATAFVLLREYFDDTIRVPDDVERKLDLPLLGLLPIVDEPGEALEDSKSALSEAYSSLVVNLSFSTPSGLPHVLVVTSAQQAEGKSTTSHTIALMLSRLGRKVLLVDGDLRRPTLHSTWASRDKPGLSQLLVGNVEFDDVLQESENENLSYITALPIPPQPSLLLGGPRLAKFVSEARERYDVVIIDCPPMLGLSDTASITQHADGVLMIVNAQAFHRGAIKSALRRLHIIGSPILGVVLSMFDMKNADSEYSYYGYNYYRYGDDKHA